LGVGNGQKLRRTGVIVSAGTRRCTTMGDLRSWWAGFIWSRRAAITACSLV